MYLCVDWSLTDFFQILSIQLADLFVVHCVMNVSTLIVLNVLCAKRWDIYIQLTQSSGLESSLCAGLVSWIKIWLLLPRFFYPFACQGFFSFLIPSVACEDFHIINLLESKTEKIQHFNEWVSLTILWAWSSVNSDLKGTNLVHR